MKPPRPKPHLVLAAEPLQSGKDCVASCGEVLKHAEFMAQHDWELNQGSLDLDAIFRACAKCRKVSVNRARYLYLALSGQKAKQEG